MPEPISKKTILLVEDEALIAMNEAAVLARYGFEVITAYSAQAAVETARSKSIDLILMDIDLGHGRMDGTEAAEIILREKDIPVVFLSSHIEPEVVEKTEGITSYGYIVKNSGETVVLASIKMAFRLFEANRKIRERKEKLKQYIGLIEERNKHLVELYEKMDSPQEDLFHFVLEGSISITNSNYGFSGFINENESVMSIFTWSQDAMNNCSVSDKPMEFPIEKAGIWGDCIRERKPVIINDYDSDMRPSKHGTPEGHVRIRRFLSVPVFDGEKIVAVGAVANKNTTYDIADADSLMMLYDKMWTLIKQQRAEKTLRESEERYKKAQSAARVGNWEYHIETDTFWGSDEGKRIYGLDAASEDFNAEEVMKCVVEKDRVNQAMTDLLEKNIPYDIEFDIIPRNSKKRKTIHSIAELEKDEYGNPVKVIGVLHDITDRKDVEKRLHEQNGEIEILRQASMAVLENTSFKIAAQKIFDYAKMATGARSGYIALLSEDGSENEVLFLDDGGLPCTVDPNLPMPIRGLRETAYRTGNAVLDNDFMQSEWVRFMPEGHVILKNVLFAPLPVEGKVVGIMGLANKNGDFTQRNLDIAASLGGIAALALKNSRAAEQLQENKLYLQQALEEKEHLMKELNHRVKNNLSMIASLINLQMPEDTENSQFVDLKRQIDAIRIVHERLHTGNKLSRIVLKGYIQDLLELLFGSFTSKAVRIHNTIEEIEMDSGRAVPLGLIINELATNAIKYGFANGREAVFAVDLRTNSSEKDCVLTISNSGSPFPEDIDLDNPGTLGLRLITALVRQLKGTVNLKRDPHPVFTIRFPKDAA